MNSRKLAILGAVLIAAVPFASASTLQLGSYATGAVAPAGDVNTALNYAGFSVTSAPSVGTASSYTLNPATTWAPAVPNSTWVGNATTAGPGGTNPAVGYYTFTTMFSGLATSYSGTFAVMADDTTEVILNGVVLIPFGVLGSDNHCADGPPNCNFPDIFNLSGIMLNGGVNNNVLTFVVEQAGYYFAPGDPSGLDFSANLSTTPATAPEPSSLMLMGTGLLSAAIILIFRRRSAMARQRA